MNEPINHHYIPVFYLSRWAGADGCVCRFNRPYGSEIKTKRINPRGTGFEPDLYRGLEREFMQPLDSEAAGALVLLEREAVEQDWSDGQRSAWSRFILAQMLRAPEDITLLISLVRQTFEADEKIQEMAQGANVTDAEMRAYVEQRRDTQPYELARMLMDHEGIGARFNKMHWRVLDVGSDIPLLTSDRPVWMTATISEDDALLWMPIGPRKLFTATVCLTTQRMLFAKSRREVAKNVNELVVRHAVNYVYGLSDSALVFVQKYFATRKHSSLLERLAAYRGLKTVAPDSDLAKT